VSDLERRLREGTGADDAELARALRVAAVDELGFARALTQAVAKDAAREPTPRWSLPPELAPHATAERTFLHRLSVSSSDGERGIDRLEDVRTLLAVLRGGSLRQRRAAILRLGEIGGAADADTRTRIDAALATVRDEDLGLEAGRARARLGVSDVAEIEADDAQAARVLAELSEAIPRFYEGELERDPLVALDAEGRALVGSRLARAPELVVAHLAALLEGASAVSDEAREARAAWVAAIRSAGDARLVPTLGALLDARERVVALDAARALGRIDTASAHALLSSAFRRSNTPADRAVLGGMLGLHGDPAVLSELRDTMRAEDPRARLAAVEAIGPIATSEDFEPLASLLGTSSLALDRAIVRSLGRLGDARAVRLLRGLRTTDRGPALAVDVEEALRAVRAQMDLRGEKDVPEGAILPVITRAESPWWARAIARVHMLVAEVQARLGMHARALRRLDRAIERARDLATPWVAKGRIFMARGSSAEALVVFRRAIEIDRASVERTPLAVRAVARAFLERSEATRREGRRDVAQGLLEEALTLDRRRAPLPLRQALAREREKLAREEGT
jgi:tetratricopeptide (TPR) repeat protein